MKCRRCGASEVVLKSTRSGARVAGCMGYPNCTASLFFPSYVIQVSLIRDERHPFLHQARGGGVYWLENLIYGHGPSSTNPPQDSCWSCYLAAYSPSLPSVEKYGPLIPDTRTDLVLYKKYTVDYLQHVYIIERFPSYLTTLAFWNSELLALPFFSSNW